MKYSNESPPRRYRSTELIQDHYIITGILVNGKRFKAIQTVSPQHYNIWKGSIWKLDDNGKRKLIKRI